MIFTEILSAIGKEIADAPMTMVAEVVQFLLLVGIIWVVAFGFGKRRGFVANMLSERKSHVAQRLEEALSAEGRLGQSMEEARQRDQAAAEEAERLLAEAKASATASEEQARLDADAEAARILERANAALENERVQMQADLREQLVELVSQATRSIMNEKLTVAEQRSRIEEAITAGVATAGDSGNLDRSQRRSADRARPAVAGGE
ncbi:MAG: ATP synthase F0 subunit B [Coriobacteriia bacterium]|nr:ATP synthase F0 subunit B [Coriobacteriia bacterium]